MPSYGWDIYDGERYLTCTYSTLDAERWRRGGFQVKKFKTYNLF